MHRVLQNQFKRLKLDPDQAISEDNWRKLLELVDRAYLQADQDRYLLERSLAISSKEMQELYDEEKRVAAQALKVSEGRFRSLFDNAHDSIFLIDPESRKIIDVNAIAAQRLGYAEDELIGMEIDKLNTSSEVKENKKIFEEIKKLGKLTFERTHIRKDGSKMPVEVSTAYQEMAGRKLLQSMVRDITNRKIAEEKLIDLASHDTLTHLKNRAVFDDRLSHAIELAKRKDEKLAVLFVDLDNFKEVNDAFGHKAGDELLISVAKRLAEGVRSSDTVARFGGDEFVILLEGIVSADDVFLITQKLIEILSQAFSLEGAEVFVTASVGISIFPRDGQSTDQLIQNADRAMYLCKRTGKNSFEFFNAGMKTRALEKLEISNQLRKALDKQQFLLHFQPQVNSISGKIFGAEALIRWEKENGEVAGPSEFLSIAEESGLILEIGEWVLEEACRQMVEWTRLGIAPNWISVNVSDREINRPDFIEMLEDVLHRTQIDPKQLEIELTENIIFKDMEKTRLTLGRIKDLGVRLAIDDFGTGYSTLQYLAHFPIDTLKIDRHYAEHLESSSKDAAVVDGIVKIAKNLGLNVIGEGVEKQGQLTFYEEIECTNIQGWFFSKDLAKGDIEKLLAKGGIERPQMKLDLQSRTVN